MGNVDVSVNTLVSRNEIPIIDLSLKESDFTIPKSLEEKIAKQLHQAFSTNGVAFLINHGISEDKFQSVNNIMDTFCSLPDHTKEQYKTNPPEQVTGYVPPGMEALHNSQQLDIRHAYNISRLSEKLPTPEIDNFRVVIEDVIEDFTNLTNLLFKIIAETLKVDPEVLQRIHKGMFEKDNFTTFRMLYYPPVDEEPPTNTTRCGEHNDWGTFTLLTQDIDGGLEIIKDGEWRRVGHLPGGLLINMADMMEVWTSSRYKSVRHRVVIPEEKSARSKGRHSVAFFVQPYNKTLLHPSALRRNNSENLVEDSSDKNSDKIISASEYITKKFAEAYSA